jgi:hypothetical protein
MSMKKTVLATVGVASACASCCAFPLVVTLISGLCVAGLAALDWKCSTIGGEMGMMGTGMAASLTIGASTWYVRRWRNACTVTAQGETLDNPTGRCAAACSCPTALGAATAAGAKT